MSKRTALVQLWICFRGLYHRGQHMTKTEERKAPRDSAGFSNCSPSDEGLQLAHSTDSYRAHNDGHDAQRPYCEENVISLSKAHAEKLLRHLLAEKSEERGEVAKEIVWKLVPAKLLARVGTTVRQARHEIERGCLAEWKTLGAVAQSATGTQPDFRALRSVYLTKMCIRATNASWSQINSQGPRHDGCSETCTSISSIAHFRCVGLALQSSGVIGIPRWAEIWGA